MFWNAHIAYPQRHGALNIIPSLLKETLAPTQVQMTVLQVLLKQGYNFIQLCLQS